LTVNSKDPARGFRKYWRRGRDWLQWHWLESNGWKERYRRETGRLGWTTWSPTWRDRQDLCSLGFASSAQPATT